MTRLVRILHENKETVFVEDNSASLRQNEFAIVLIGLN